MTSDMRAEIVATAATLIKARGYHGFSFSDVADRVGIRKASIHYHFPTKTDLGLAVLRAYRYELGQAARDMAANTGTIDHRALLMRFLTPILDMGRVEADACLCGALGGEYPSLPPAIQAEVAGFFRDHTDWLAALLSDGRAAGAFRFQGDSAQIARFIMAAIEGAMLIKRTSGDTGYVDEVAHLAGGLLGLT